MKFVFNHHQLHYSFTRDCYLRDNSTISCVALIDFMGLFYGPETGRKTPLVPVRGRGTFLDSADYNPTPYPSPIHCWPPVTSVFAFKSN